MNQNCDFIPSFIAAGTGLAGVMLMQSPASATLDHLRGFTPAESTIAVEQTPNRIGMFDDDRAWDEAFANTTDEEFERLEEMLMEDERRFGTMPLDFAGR